MRVEFRRCWISWETMDTATTPPRMATRSLV